jgi:hypothetical protein
MTLSSLRAPLVILVGLIWASAFLEGMFTQTFIALEVTTPVVMIAAGAVFAIRNGNGKK